MKRLLAALFTLVCGTAMASVDYCRDVSNQWTVPNSVLCNGGGCGLGVSIQR